ncbi:MAG: transglycosylase SLT domain-containing protein [Myxococcota bacterium]|nr:transglycosylase SLT domain-containing protein [Myxococcota bacterium]
MISPLVIAFAFIANPPPAVQYERVLTGHTQERYVGDLNVIKEKGVLRVLTRNNSSSYFIAKGRQLGFEYEVAKAYADSIGVRLAIVVPQSRSGLIPALLKGEGDIIAAGMTVTDKRAKLISFSDTMFSVDRLIVTHRHTVKKLNDFKQLGQFELALNKYSTTFEVAKELAKSRGFDLRTEHVDPSVEMEEILRRIDSGEYEASIIDRNVFELEMPSGLNVAERVKLPSEFAKAWGVRPKSKQLRTSINEFISKNKRNLIPILYKRYFSAARRHMTKASDNDYRADKEGKISPYDRYFKKMGTTKNVDWRLLAALAFAESRFNPKAKSAFGAVGLMQVLPSTARKHGKLKGTNEEVINQLLVPEVNIRVGTSYLAWLIRHFQNDAVSPRQSIRFALAAYNVGLGHVKDARALARTNGYDENRWFHNVEKAIRLKKDPRWYRQTRYGYCRAEQPIAYVSRIQTRYDVYTRHVPFDD